MAEVTAVPDGSHGKAILHADSQASSLCCPLCPENDNSQYVSGATHLSGFNGQEYRLRDCANCGLRYWTPLKIIPEFYEDEGFEAYAGYHTSARPFPPWALPFFDRFPLRTGKLLDVGCGDGSFLARAEKAGFECFGIDLDERSIASAKLSFGLRAVNRSTLEDYVALCKDKDVRFDAITFFEVLEHQDRPSLFLTQVLELLQPGGYLAGSVPNTNRFLAGVDRRVSAGDLPPHHFLWFSQKTLEKFLRGKGLDSILVYPSGNIPFVELKMKATRLVHARLRLDTGRPIEQLMQRLVSPIVLLAAAVLWAGYRARPAHLYFQARASHGVDKT
jgi:2-polyprenyl-3-methyl-5-hydroxy-6-metoxy-1,4-benzoquinol methylase